MNESIKQNLVPLVFQPSPPDFVPIAIRSYLNGDTKRCHSLYEKGSLTGQDCTARLKGNFNFKVQMKKVSFFKIYH